MTHLLDPVLRWYRAVCGVWGSATVIVTYNRTKVDCPECLKWIAEHPREVKEK